MKSDISVIWLDLTNTYSSVPHAMIGEAMKLFSFQEKIRKLKIKYNNGFQVRFTASNFTTD